MRILLICLLLIHHVFGQGVSSEWQETLIENDVYGGSSQECIDFKAVAQSYDPLVTYTYLLASSDEPGNEISVVCTDSAAIATILSNLKGWTNGNNLGTMCDGNNWQITSCTNEPELLINGNQCSCTGDLVLRPCYTGGDQWGGAGPSTCHSVTQTLRLYFGENPPAAPTPQPTTSPIVPTQSPSTSPTAAPTAAPIVPTTGAPSVSPTIYVPESSKWEYTLTEDVEYSGLQQCTDWMSIHQTYDPLITYNYLLAESDELGNEISFVCTDSTAIGTILSNLKDWTDGDEIATMCDGHEWRVASCTGTPELLINGAKCSCTSDLSFRPCYTGGDQWGGAGPNTCNSPTQTMTYYFGEQPPPAPTVSPTPSPVPDTVVVGTAKINFNVADPDTRKAVAENALEDVKESFADPESLIVDIKTVETSVVNADLINNLNNETLFKESFAAARGCNPGECTVTIDTGSRRVLLKQRGLQQEYTVEIEFTFSEEDYASFTNLNSTLDDPSFLEALATELGVDTEDIDLTATGGTVTLEVTLTASVTDEPTGEDSLAELQEVQNSLDNATTLLVEQLGDPEDGVQTVSLDLCGSRDCNGYGDPTALNTNEFGCNTETGVCACTQNWGINCESVCECFNGGLCANNYCKCTYPYYGLKCDLNLTLACNTCGV